MKKLRRLKILCILVGLFCLQMVPALQAETPRLEPLASIMHLAKAKEPLKLDELITASLILSGIEESQLTDLKSTFYTKIDEVKAYFKGRGISPELADDLLSYIHEKYLGHYDVKQTRLDKLLKQGTYNCVSSAIFYLILSRSLGFTTYGVKTVDHSFCAVQVGGKFYDVETTSIYGFNPGEKKEFTDDFGEVTGYAYVPPGNYAQREMIGEKELLFLVLHNRVVLKLDNKQYINAVSLAVDGYALIKNDLAVTLFLQAFTQYSLWIVSSKNFAHGAEFLENASSRYYNQEKLKELHSHIVIQWALADIERADFTHAQELISSNHEKGIIHRNNYQELIVYLYQKKAEHYAKHNGNESALQVINQGLRIINDDKGLLQSKTLYTFNYIIELITEGNVTRAAALLSQSNSEKMFTEKDYTELFSFLYKKKTELVFAAEGVQAVLELLEQAMNEISDNTLLIQLGEMYLFNHIKDLIKHEKFTQAASVINGRFALLFLSQKSKNDLLLYFYINKAEKLAKTAGYLAAAGCIQEGITKIGKYSHLVQNYEVYIHNYVVELVGRNKYSEALVVLEQALTVLPASSVFKKDRRVIEDSMN